MNATEEPRISTNDIQKRTKRMNELLRNSDTILLKLKLHYMRTRGAEMTISFLYGNNIDSEYHIPPGVIKEKYGKNVRSY